MAPLKIASVFTLFLLFSSIVLCLDDPHKTLGLSKSASQEEIKKAFKYLSKKWHPDKNDNSPESQAKFILTDETKRRQFEAAKYGHRGGYEQQGFGGFSYFFQNRKPIFSETFSLTYENFDTMVDSSQDLWVIEFYTDRCAPCIENAHIWDQVAKSLSEFIKFGRINADEETALLRHFRIRSIPSVIVVSDSGTHQYKGNIEFHSLTEYVKQFQPFKISQINNERDWDKFKSIKDNNKPFAVLFSKHSSSISPLFKFNIYSHLYNFAQITTEKMDNILAPKYGVTERPSILFFADDFSTPKIVSGQFTKESLTKVLQEHKQIRVVEYQHNNFLHLCGRQSTNLCGIAFTTPNSKHFTKHLQTLKQMSSLSESVKFGWVNVDKYRHFLSAFSMAHVDAEIIKGIVIIDGKKRKYTIIQDEVQYAKLVEKLEKADIKFMDLKSLPSLVELSSISLFDGWGTSVSLLCYFIFSYLT